MSEPSVDGRSKQPGTRYRLGVDIGGTFTDVVLLGSDGSLRTKKLLSTPDDYARGVVDGAVELLGDLGIEGSAIEGVVHASTVASNAVLEGKGALTALITTAGFRDVLEMRRLRIPVMYDLQYEKPEPLVPRRRRFEIRGRLGPEGQIWTELDEDAVRQVAQQVRLSGAQALAISLLHAYANPDHERRVAEIVREVVGDDLYITCSAEILPEIREYERTSTAVVNAYVGPVVERYLVSLKDRLDNAGLGAPLQIMQSGGGIMSVDAAIRKPAHLVESGPTAGVVACSYLARATGLGNLISLDMGGTTAKVAILESGQPVKTTEYEVGAGINLSSRLIKGGGYAIRLPFIDLSEIGAGGGSLIEVDEFGILSVGPQSAGADPGPVCYGRGGTQPTLTDALVVLGYLNSEFLVGGEVKLDSASARIALEEQVAGPLGKSLLDAAYGAFSIAIATMTRAVKAVSTYRGRDPRDFVLCGFGGNGPVAAVEIARMLQMSRVLIPPAPGVFSATGLLLSQIEHEFVQTALLRGEGLSGQSLDEGFVKLEQSAFTALAKDGYTRERIVLLRSADMRYAGQAYELSVPVAEGLPDVHELTRGFNEEHLRTYGHASDDHPVDVVNLKVVARVVEDGNRPYDPVAGLTAGVHSGQTRSAYFGPEHGLLEVPVVPRAALLQREWIGPLIVDEYDSTCLIPAGWRAAIDELGNIDITREAGEHG